MWSYRFCVELLKSIVKYNFSKSTSTYNFSIFIYVKAVDLAPEGSILYNIVYEAEYNFYIIFDTIVPRYKLCANGIFTLHRF